MEKLPELSSGATASRDVAEPAARANRYPLPLYLNQKYVFDLLAMMEGGLSQLETVKSTSVEQTDSARRATGDVGIKNVFAFLGVSLSGERSSKATSGQAEEVTREKVYTPNSLFWKLRERLYDNRLVVSVGLPEVKPGEFVEFRTTLQKNPLVDALEGFIALMKTALIFAVEEQPQQKAKNKGGQQKPTVSVPGRVLEQMEALLKQLYGGGTLDVIGGQIDGQKLRAVLTLDQAFLGDPLMSDLLDGQYAVLGKVTRALGPNSNESINLLRKTSLSRIGDALLAELKQAFEGMGQSGIRVPELTTEVKGPALQVLPIAIFA